MALWCMSAMKTSNSAKDYAFAFWTAHVRSATHQDLGDELLQELIWLIGNEDSLVQSYLVSQDENDVEDIIPFVRSMVVRILPLNQSEPAVDKFM